MRLTILSRHVHPRMRILFSSEVSERGPCSARKSSTSLPCQGPAFDCVTTARQAARSTLTTEHPQAAGPAESKSRSAGPERVCGRLPILNRVLKNSGVPRLWLRAGVSKAA